MAWALASFTLAAAVPVVLIATNLNGLFYDPDFYARGQARYAVGRTTEYTIEALRPINAGIVAFFQSPGVSLPTALMDAGADRNVFNQREVGHMEDVRSIVRLIGRLQNLALSVAIALVLGRFVAYGQSAWRWTATRLAIGAATTLGIVALMGALSLVDFEQLFLTFHKLSFDNDLWQLDPRRDNLIRFFPFEFWFDATVTVALRAVLSGLVLGGAALIARRWLRGGSSEYAVP